LLFLIEIEARYELINLILNFLNLFLIIQFIFHAERFITNSCVPKVVYVTSLIQ